MSGLFASGGQSIGASPSVSSEYSRLISFKIDLFDLLAVQGTLKSLLQHHSSKASVLWCSAFFMVQLIPVHDYQKNHSFDYRDLCRQSDVSAFNMLSSFSSKEQASFNFMAAVTIYNDFGAQENKI